MNINRGQTGIFWLGNQTQNTNIYGSQRNSRGGKGTDSNARAIRRMLSEAGQDGRKTAYPGSIVENSLSYSESIRAARTKKKSTDLQMKKLHYSFKSISTQILRSKTSVAARQVAGKARREVIRLKNQKYGGQYDEQDLQIAINHAQAMERVAKKKVRHLLEEEMIKTTGGPCLGDLEEREDEKNRSAEDAIDETLAREQAFADSGEFELQDNAAQAMQEQMQAYQEMMQSMRDMAALQEQAASATQDMMSDLAEEMSQSMKELLEDSGLSDLAESMFATVQVEMDPADYKMMKIRHRAKELQEIAKADAEYLKAVFNKLEKAKEAAAQASYNANNNGNSPGGGYATGGAVMNMSGGSQETPMPEIDIVSAPGEASAPSAPAPTMSVSIDISL